MTILTMNNNGTDIINFSINAKVVENMEDLKIIWKDSKSSDLLPQHFIYINRIWKVSKRASFLKRILNFTK